MAVKKLSKSQRYNENQRAKGLRKATVWIPEGIAYDELMHLATTICEFHLEKGEYHKDLFPSMYRDVNTGVMGNKSLDEVKKAASKNENKS